MPVEKNPALKNPEAPFVFINLFEIAEDDIEQFVSDWERRAKVMGQQPGFMSANVYKSLLPDNQFQLVNVAQWQSYDAWVAANNDPTYAQQLAEDLGHTPNVKVNRGFYRPVTSYTHLYD